MAGIWAGLETSSPQMTDAVIQRQGRELMLALNRYQALIRKLGLSGPLE
jgi:hypothetical protein